MKRFACIPDSPSEAAAKLRCGLGECASFIASAPVSAYLSVYRAFRIGLARLRSAWKGKARSIAVWALQNIAWTILAEIVKLLIGL